MRARIKAFEDMPERFKCCVEASENIKKTSGRILTLVGQPFIARYECSGVKFIESSYKTTDFDFKFIPIDSIDIEEGS